MNNLRNELGHPFEDINQATGNAMGLKVTVTFHACNSFILGKTKRAGGSKLAVACSKIKSKCLYFVNKSQSIGSFEGKRN